MHQLLLGVAQLSSPQGHALLHFLVQARVLQRDRGLGCDDLEDTKAGVVEAGLQLAVLLFIIVCNKG